MRLALLRHGHTEWNRAGRIQGRSDIALDPSARADLAALRLPEGWQQAAVCASPLLRARETAELVTGRAPIIVPALTEMNWGRWEGLRGADLAGEPNSGFRHIEEWGWGFRPPGGESPAEVAARLRPWWQTLQRDTLAICHIGVMRVLLAQAYGWQFHGAAPFAVKRARLYVIHIDGTGLSPATTPPERLERR